MTTYRFRELKYPAKRRVTCATCGRKFTRQKTFTQTVNPFNKNADGTVKTWMCIIGELQKQAAEWEPEPYCGRIDCETAP